MFDGLIDEPSQHAAGALCLVLRLRRSVQEHMDAAVFHLNTAENLGATSCVGF